MTAVDLKVARDAWWLIAKYPERCAEGGAETCNRPAIAVRIELAGHPHPYPVCLEHARDPLVPFGVAVRSVQIAIEREKEA